jgi:site-specific DNA recombinase
MIPAKPIDELVWQDLCAVLTHPEVIEAALLRAQGGAWLPQELQARRENLRKAQLGVNQQVERLTEAYLAGIIPLEELKRRRQDASSAAGGSGKSDAPTRGECRSAARTGPGHEHDPGVLSADTERT